MKFGKQIQAQAIGEWSEHYMNYKGLKKVISSLEQITEKANGARNGSGHSAHSITIAAPPVPIDAPPETIDGHPQVLPPGADPVTAVKATFFFKLERELDRVNKFYLTKEADLSLRLRTLLEKKRIIKDGGAGGASGRESNSTTASHLKSIQEALWQLQQDLTKLQHFVELNATGFRKILKKWDKRSKSSTKELYLARQVEVQPCFNRDTLTELTDIVASNLGELNQMDLATVASPAAIPSPYPSAGIAHPLRTDSFRDVECELATFVRGHQWSRLKDALTRLANSADEFQRVSVSRVLLRACKVGSKEGTEVILGSTLPSVYYRDEINERNCLHNAALAKSLACIQLCMEYAKDSPEALITAQDVYGRTAMHYAAMGGSSEIVGFFLARVPNASSIFDHDGCTPLIYAVLGGFHACVSRLLRDGEEPPHHVLSLATQAGHVGVVELLLSRGAPVQPKDGLHPLHIAAKQGHVQLTELLCQYEPADVSDKYHNWTPLVYAASEGKIECVRVLLKHGAHVEVKDEAGWTALTHALYHGHVDLALLLSEHSMTCSRAGQSPALPPNSAGHDAPIQPIAPSRLFNVPRNDADEARESGGDSDLDAIPSLALPPPIIPFRIYGHMYLESKFQLQVWIANAPVLYAHKLASIRLVLTAKPDTGSIPHSIILPTADDREVFAFQTADLKGFRLHVAVFPTYGTKPLAHGAVLANDLVARADHGKFSIPLLDTTAVVGELEMQYAIVTPFSHQKLAVGGIIDTYWKSTQVVPQQPAYARTLGGHTGASVSSTLGGHVTMAGAVSSLMASPLLPSGMAVAGGGAVASLITASSLAPKYVQVTVQLTSDGVPVVYPLDNLKVSLPTGGTLPVPLSMVTLSQFRAIGSADPHNVSLSSLGLSSSSAEMAQALRTSYLTLASCLSQLPRDMGVIIELKQATPTGDVNQLVDKVLAPIYDQPHQRPIVLSSLDPDICNAANWKQPNYAVFFATHGGFPSGSSSPRAECLSIKGAVRFAKTNNLLGILCFARPLLQEPKLIASIKESGLVLASFGDDNSLPANVMSQEKYGVDGVFANGVLRFTTSPVQPL